MAIDPRHDESPRDTPEVVLFGVGETSRRVGVPAATLRTWSRRYGLSATARTGGSHRRYTLDDIRRLQQMRHLIEEGVPAGHAAARVQGSLGSLTVSSARETWRLRGRGDRGEQLAQAVIDLEVHDILAAVSAALEEWGAATTWRRLLVPMLVQLGEEWERTDCGIEIEHVASATIETALRTYTAGRDMGDDLGAVPPRGRVLLACTPKEAHTIPLDALAAALADAGLASVMVGAMPVPDLATTVVHTEAEAAVIWAHAASTADPEVLAALRSLEDVGVYAAGPGWDRVALPGGVTRLTSLTHAMRHLRRARTGQGRREARG